MTDEQLIAWIDQATLTDLLWKNRFAAAGSPFFSGEVGEHFLNTMAAKRSAEGAEAWTRASKSIGWGDA